jgi:hypothetical protein
MYLALVSSERLCPRDRGTPTRAHHPTLGAPGSARPVHSRLTRGQSSGPPPGQRVWGSAQGHFGPCAAGPRGKRPADSVGSRRGPSSAWLRPRFSPAFPGPAHKLNGHNEGSGCSGGSLSRRPGLAPRASCGATFGRSAVRDLARQFRSGGSVPGTRD